MPRLTTLASGSIKGFGFLNARAIGSLIIPGTLWVWGNNQTGALGLNNVAPRSSPTQIPGTQWTVISTARTVPGSGSAAIKSDGTLWVWGTNGFGILADNSTIPKSSPIQVPGTEWCAVDGSESGRLALKTNGTLWSWGSLVGDNTAINRSSPVQIPGDQWCFVFANPTCAKFAIKTNGTLWVWGNETYGQLGNQSTSNASKSSPIQIPGNWTCVGGGFCFNIATKTDGTLWSWGRNLCGELANLNTCPSRDSPGQVPGTAWSSVASGAGCLHMGAIKTDGTLWMWGCGWAGQAGNNTAGYLNSFSSPVQVPGNEWCCLTIAKEAALALKIDGTLWSWGQANDGVLGLNNVTPNRSSPTQIPGTQWIDVNGGFCGHVLARKRP